MAGQINEATQESTGGFADPTAAGPASAPSQERKSGSWLSWLVSDDPPGRALLNVTMLVDLGGVALCSVPFPRHQGAGRRRAHLHFRDPGRELRPHARLHRHRLVCAHDVLRHRRLWRGDHARQRLGRLERRSILGTLAGAVVSLVVAAVIGLLSLRLRAIFFSMITLAVAGLRPDRRRTVAQSDRRRRRADVCRACHSRPQLPAGAR